MKSLIATSLALAGAVTAVPAPAADPVRIVPFEWAFNITALEGPGCPDFSDPSPSGYSTRLTYGENTVDGSEIYYWHVAYPYLKASVDKDTESAHTWCETTLSYTELNDYPKGTEPTADYRLKLHKNGTNVIAVYDLEEGVEAEWKFTYYPEDHPEIVDTIKVAGPRDDTPYGQTDNSPVGHDLDQAPLPKCGAGTIKYRTDLTLTSKKGGKGTVASETFVVDKKTEYYGVQPGFSYDWEECSK